MKKSHQKANMSNKSNRKKIWGGKGLSAFVRSFTIKVTFVLCCVLKSLGTFFLPGSSKTNPFVQEEMKYVEIYSEIRFELKISAHESLSSLGTIFQECHTSCFLRRMKENSRRQFCWQRRSICMRALLIWCSNEPCLLSALQIIRFYSSANELRGKSTLSCKNCIASGDHDTGNKKWTVNVFFGSGSPLASFFQLSLNSLNSSEEDAPNKDWKQHGAPRNEVRIHHKTSPDCQV